MAVRTAAHSRTSSVSAPFTPNRSSATTVPTSESLLTPSSIVTETKSENHTSSVSSTHHHRGMSKITATNTPRKRDDFSAHSTPNARKASFSTASAAGHDSDTKETKEHHHHRRTESESVSNAAPIARSRRPSIGGPPPRSSIPKATTARERGPNFLATFDPERFICRPPKHAKKKKKAKAGEKTTSDQHGLSRLDLAELWRHYDKNENGMLDPNEIEELAEDIIDRVPALYKEVLRRDKPSASESNLDEMVAGDLPEIMPGSKSAIVGIMSKELPSNYPQNRKIREHEFTARWNHVAQILFSRMYSNENTGALQCIIL